MKKDFRLQKVLEYRERLLEEQKKRLGDLKIQEKNLREQLALKNQVVEQKRQEMEDQKRANQFAFAQMYMKYINQLIREANVITRDIQETLKKIKAQQKATNEALNDVKMIEKLKEKHIENYQQFLKTEEMKFVDEVNIGRRSRGNG